MEKPELKVIVGTWSAFSTLTTENELNIQLVHLQYECIKMFCYGFGDVLQVFYFKSFEAHFNMNTRLFNLEIYCLPDSLC